MQTHGNLKVIDYEPRYKNEFESLNKAWISKYFSIEPLDEEILGDPEGAVLNKGGFILFALLDEVVVGTVAMKFIDSVTFELAKLGLTMPIRVSAQVRRFVLRQLKKQNH